MNEFEVIPALDIRDSRVVRLRQGDYDLQTNYAADPLEAASAYARAGSRWLHLVDLDAARSGGYSLHWLLEGLAGLPLQVQTGGGVREDADVDGLIGAGVARVVVGTIAVRDPTRVCRWIERHGPERITIALDTRADEAGEWQLPVAGWTEASEMSLDRLLDVYAAAGARHVLCTDIARDGMLAGFNIPLYRRLAAGWPGLRFQASGGVRSVDDIAAARDAGASGAILGRALLDGNFSLGQALSC